MKFSIINSLCDRLEKGEISEETFNRLCDKYVGHVAFFDSLPTVVENGVRHKHVEAGPGSRRLRVA